MSQSLDALANRPAFARTTVSEQAVKHGPMCTGERGCTTRTSGGDRSQVNYLQIAGLRDSFHKAEGEDARRYVRFWYTVSPPPLW